MADSVTVEHDGVSITTNTASEADLRTEMETPAVSPSPAADATPSPGPGRDERGRFVQREASTPPAETPPPTEPAPETEPPARRRDETLPRHNPIARLNQALAQKAEAERRATMLEAELARARQSGATSPVAPPAPTAVEPSEPQFEQFASAPDPYTAYMQAWARWDHAQQLRQARTEWQAEQIEQAKAQTFQSRLHEGRSRLPDFDAVLTEADTLGLQVSAVMQEAIAESPYSADLVYFLATHPEECTQLAEESQQTPVAAATVMRRLLESHLAPRAASTTGRSGPAARASVSTAKPPIMPVGSSPVVSDEPPGETASAAEHARYWNRRLKVPGTR